MSEQGLKAIKILYLKNALMIKEVKKLDSDFVLSTRIEYANMLSKYAPGGYMGKIIYPLLTPLKERLEAGERTPDLYNAIVEATR